MTLVWGIPEGEYKPQLFDVQFVRNSDWHGCELLTMWDGKKVEVRTISTQFHMDERDLNNLMNHYGIAEYYRIIGRRKCEEFIYETDIHNKPENSFDE